MKLGTKVYVKEIAATGVVVRVDELGSPLEIMTDAGKVVEVINMTVTVLTALRKLILFIKEWFK